MEVRELTKEQLESLLTTTEVAEMFDTEPRIVRREAKKGNIPGHVEIMGQHGFLPDEVEEWEVPESTGGSRGSVREDNRLRWKIWLTKEEEEALEAEGYEIENPRAKARARRARRRAAEKAQEEEVEATSELEADDSDDPFADFEV